MSRASVKNKSVFFVSATILKYLLQFLNEYGELETVKPGDQAKALFGAAVEVSVAGG